MSARIEVKCGACRVTVATVSRDAVATALQTFAILAFRLTPTSLVAGMEERGDLLCPSCLAARNAASLSTAKDNAR